jgi:AAA domain
VRHVDRARRARGTVKGLYGIHEAAKLARRGERTLFVCSEDALDYIVRPRFQAADCDGELAFALSIETDAGERVPHFPSDLPLLEEAIDAIRPQLVIVDPIASYIDPGLDMSKNNQMRQILQPLIDLARDAHVAILVVYHLGKQRERGAIGSVAFEDACRQVLTAARDDDDEDVRHVQLTKSNIGPTGYGRRLRIVGVPLELDGEVVEVAKLVDEGRSWKSVPDLLAKRGSPGPEPEKRKVARDILVDALIAGGTDGINADEAKRVIAAKADVSPLTVWRAFSELKSEELAVAVAKRDETGSILEWRWVPKLALLLGRNDA